MAETQFQRGLRLAKNRLRRAEVELLRTRAYADRNEMDAAFRAALSFEEEAEKLTLLARTLPAYTGDPRAMRLAQAVTERTMPVEMGYTAEGWFCLRIPALLPHKERGSTRYIQEALYPAMQKFFAGKIPKCCQGSVTAFRHIYDESRPERAWRDHDNIECNMVTDILALYLMPDDAPKYCSHFYCSDAGQADRTEVYIVPRTDFQKWLRALLEGELEEVVLLDDVP